jgi:hypothetical protein
VFPFQLFFVKEKSFQAAFGDLLHQPPRFLIIRNPLSDSLFHGLRNMDHLSLSSHPQGKVKTWVKLASGALAARLATGPLHGDQATTKEGLFVKELGESGPGPSFWIW